MGPGIQLTFALEQTTARIDQLEGVVIFFSGTVEALILVELQDYAGGGSLRSSFCGL